MKTRWLILLWSCQPSREDDTVPRNEKNKNKTRSSLSVIFQPGREENREVRWRRCTAAFIEGSGSWEAQQEPRLLPFLSCGRVGVIISTQGMLVVSFNNVFTADRVSHYHRTSIFFSSSSSSQEYRFVDTHCKKKSAHLFLTRHPALLPDMSLKWLKSPLCHQNSAILTRVDFI